MQSNDPIFALLGLFILSTTFFFCGKEPVTSPPSVGLESQSTIPPPAPKISEPPPVSTPMGLNEKSDDRLIGQTITHQIAGAPPLSDGKMLASTVAAMLHDVPTVDSDVSEQRNNVGFGHEQEVLSGPRAQSNAADLRPRRIVADQPTPNEFRMSRLVAGRPADARSWQHRRIEWFIGTEREQP